MYVWPEPVSTVDHAGSWYGLIRFAGPNEVPSKVRQ